MNITPQLLERYHLGTCTEAERAAVEAWLVSIADEPSDLSEASQERMETNIWQLLASQISPQPTKVVPLYMRLSRYAAVAIIMLGIFFSGYFSGVHNATYAKTTAAKTGIILKDLLYVTGGDGAFGIVAGDRFIAKFEGRIKLHNSSDKQKIIICGEKEFVLAPLQTYYLSGSEAHPSLVNSMQLKDIYNDVKQLEGDFSIVKLDE
ncbi:MAG: hypothetical protein AAGA10_18400 [Bacteroidota bacterium]